MASVNFTLDRMGGADILRNNQSLISMEHKAMNSILSTIEAQFLVEFGVEGKFNLSQFTGERTSVRIMAADSMTGAILKRHPGWLGQYTDNISI